MSEPICDLFGNAACQAVANAARERAIVDLRGLGPALRARAKAMNSTVAAVARLAVVRMLEDSGIALPKAAVDSAASQPVKITIRVPRRVAQEMATRARAAGLSQGALLDLLIAGASALPSGADRMRAVATLTASTDALAPLANDVKGLGRRLRSGTLPSTSTVDATLDELSCAMRSHIDCAARVIADLAPLAALGRKQEATQAKGRGADR